MTQIRHALSAWPRSFVAVLTIPLGRLFFLFFITSATMCLKRSSEGCSRHTVVAFWPIAHFRWLWPGIAFSDDYVEHGLVLRNVSRDGIFRRVVAFECGGVIFKLDHY